MSDANSGCSSSSTSSGKTELAVRMAAGAGRVVVVATAEAGDEEMAERIRRHRARRPAGWTTIEEPVELTAALEGVPEDGFVVVDCLTLWVANLLERGCSPAEVEDRSRRGASPAAAPPRGGGGGGDESGSGILPIKPLARNLRNMLGTGNT